MSRSLELDASRFALALDMFELGVAMKRQQFLRKNPAASPQEIDDMVASWLHRSDEERDVSRERRTPNGPSP